MATRPFVAAGITRRALVGSSLAGAGLLSLGAAQQRGVAFEAPVLVPAARQQTTLSPTEWRTWYLSSSDELRPDDPGDPTQAEIDELIQLQVDRTEDQSAMAVRWGPAFAIAPWTELVSELLTEFNIAGMPQGRFLAHYYTAIHDAVIAAWDAQRSFERPSPGATNDELTPLAGVDSELPSFPSQHAAIAGAATAVLAGLLPDAEPGRFDAIAEEAANSRLIAGAAYRSDIEAGLAIGRAVGEMAVARSKSDGSDAKWDPATRPTGPGYWEPTPPGFVETPAAPLAGSWEPWILSSGDQCRPAAPPEYGSPAMEAELKMVQELSANLTFEQRRAAQWWAAASPMLLYTGWAQDLIAKEGLDLPYAAQVLADINVAIADGIIAVWDAKYTWWTARPITLDPDLKTVVPNPPYPSYPSGYSAVVGAASTVVGHYFPESADDMAARAWEAAASRAWAGIHYVIDDDVGLAMGRQVGRLICTLP